MELKKAVIIAGGEALRLQSSGISIPKAMIEVKGKPLILRILLWLKENGIEEVIIGVDYKKETIMEYLKDGSQLGLKIYYNDHHGATGTGEAFKRAIEKYDIKDDVFFLMNGDQLTYLDIKIFLRFHKRHNPTVTILSYPAISPYGIVHFKSGANIIERFVEKPIIDNLYMNTGIYIFSQKIKQYLPEKGSIESKTFKELAERGEVCGFRYDGFFRTMNDVKDLKEMEKHLEKEDGL